MEVKIISECTVKPSSPTPLHLKTHKFSYFDQYMFSYYAPGILFYPKNHSISVEERSKVLKQSLSETLSKFYPLAGRVKDRLSIDCNDEGVPYFRSQVNCDLHEFLRQPDDLSLLQKFSPCEYDRLDDKSTIGWHVAFVQENVFECGGIALAVCANHKLIDGMGMSTFVKYWCGIARGIACRGSCDPGQVVLPDFVTAPSLFPQNDAFPQELTLSGISAPLIKYVKAVTKRFVFDSSSLAALKLKAASPLVPNPSRVEVVTAIIWKCAALAFNTNSHVKKATLLTHAVNMRARTKPPLPESAMGNFPAFMVVATQDEIHSHTDMRQLVHAIRGAVVNMKSDFYRSKQGDGGYNSFLDASKEVSQVFSSADSGTGGAEMLAFTSWITFGIYKLDFGWGNPVWFATTGLSDEVVQAHNDQVVFTETKEGNGGIEATVTLSASDMAIFECNQELAAFSCLNPSPLLGLSNA